MRARGRVARAALGLVVTVAAAVVPVGQALAGTPGGARTGVMIRSVAPAAPIDVYAVGYVGSARVGWIGPDDGGSPVTSVIVEDSLGSSWAFPAPDNPLVVVPGLAAGVTRTFTVRLVNADGTSASSAPSNPVAAHAPYPGPTFTPTGSPLTSWQRPGAVRLADGRVLVVGGTRFDPATWTSVPLATAELYDPATGSWTATGSLPAPRSDFSLTVLPSGRVLLAGGYDPGWNPVATTFLYNPATGAWTAARSMRVARASHSATLLPAGTVLVAGGTTVSGGVRTATASAEVYTPPALRIGTGSWALTGAMPVARTRHAAVTIGRRLTSRVLVVGGNDGSGGVAAAAVYRPLTGTWATTGSLVQLRSGDDVGDPTVTLLASGKVLVAGGYQGRPLESAELYDPATGAFTLTGSMPIPLLGGHTATRLTDGRVLVVGGIDDWGGLAVAQLYDPVAGTWSRANDLPVERADHVAVLLTDGSVLVAGGQRWLPAYGPEATALRYLP